MSDPTQKMGPEVWNSGAVLFCRSMAQAVVENRLEPIVFAACDVGMPIEHDAGRLLANPLPHHSRLAMLDMESFLQANRRDMKGEPVNGSREYLASREHQVVGIACVTNSRGAGQAVKSTVEPVGAEVRQAGEGGAPCGRCGWASRRATTRLPDCGPETTARSRE